MPIRGGLAPVGTVEGSRVTAAARNQGAATLAPDQPRETEDGVRLSDDAQAQADDGAETTPLARALRGVTAETPETAEKPTQAGEQPDDQARPQEQEEDESAARLRELEQKEQGLRRELSQRYDGGQGRPVMDILQDLAGVRREMEGLQEGAAPPLGGATNAAPPAGGGSFPWAQAPAANIPQSFGGAGGVAPNFGGFPGAGQTSFQPGAFNGDFGDLGGQNPVNATGANVGATDRGQMLARMAEGHATGTGGYCYKYVADSLDRLGINLSGRSAYMAAGQLASHPGVREIKGLGNGDLTRLPAGAVVVWNRSNRNPNGHISVALGDGREASDVVRSQITNYGTAFRVFMPK